MAKNPNIDTQTALEVIYSKHKLITVLKEQFAELLVDYIGPNKEVFLTILVQIYLHRQADPVTMVGILTPKHGTPQQCADALLAAVELDLLDFDTNTGKFSVKYLVTEDVQAMLDRYQYPLPMVIPPRPVTGNFQTGYCTINKSIILNGSEYFDADLDLCLDHINRANSVSLHLNFDVIDCHEAAFQKPKRKIGEDFEDYNKRAHQANIFYTTSYEVMKGLQTCSDEVYMTYRYDRRGRCYSSGYHVNPQGTDYNKAVLELSKKEKINVT